VIKQRAPSEVLSPHPEVELLRSQLILKLRQHYRELCQQREGKLLLCSPFCVLSPAVLHCSSFWFVSVLSVVSLVDSYIVIKLTSNVMILVGASGHLFVIQFHPFFVLLQGLTPQGSLLTAGCWRGRWLIKGQILFYRVTASQ